MSAATPSSAVASSPDVAPSSVVPDDTVTFDSNAVLQPSLPTPVNVGKIKFLRKSVFQRDRFPKYEDVSADLVILTPKRIYAVSHMWELKVEPDPHQMQFKHCKETLGVLMSDEDGVFYDYSGIYQGEKVAGKDERVFPTKDVEKAFFESLRLISNIFYGNLHIQTSTVKKYQPQTTVLTLHYHPQAMVRGWPYFEMYQAWKGKNAGQVTIMGHALNIKPRATLLAENAARFLDKFSLDDLNEFLKEFATATPEFRKALDELERARHGFILKCQKTLETAAANKTFSSVSPADFAQVMEVLKLAPHDQVFTHAGNAGLNPASQFFNIGPTAGVMYVTPVCYVWQQIISRVRFRSPEDDAPSKYFVNEVVQPQLNYLAMIDLCFCTFTSGKDSDAVKELIFKKTKPVTIKYV